MKVRVLCAASAVALSAAVIAALPAVQASAVSASPSAKAVAATAPTPLPVGQSDANLSSNALSSWQTDNTVWAVAYAKGVVYVGGQFLNARPPGAAVGVTTGEVSRTYLAAFSSTTGALITSFDPVITSTSSTPGVYGLAVSPDGSTLYVGGLFGHVNGSYRDNLAAFNTSTGALTSWAPQAYGKVNAIAVAPSGNEIYIGGGFDELGTVGTSGGLQDRTYAGAVDNTGNLQPWAPVLDNAVTTIAVDPDDSQVLVGGYFDTINGAAQPAAGAVDPVNGTTNVPWGANIVPDDSSCYPPAVKDIVISNGTAYLSSEGTGGGCFDGDFAVSLSSGGDNLVWQNDCLGATQALAVIDGYLFKGSHAHDCAYAPGGFPQVNDGSGGWVTHHLLDQSLTDGSLGHWTVNTDGTLLGPRAMATDGTDLFVGGDFENVNSKPQQGFAIFLATPNVYPSNPTTAPTVSSTSTGTVSVSFPAVSSADVGTLNYEIYRDGGTKAIGSVTATSWPWALPVLHFQDTGLTPGSVHTYTYRATDGTHLTGASPVSASVTVSGTSPSLSYNQTVLNNSPSFFWPLNDTGSTANDASSNGFNGSYSATGTTHGVPGPLTGSTATTFDGQSGNVASQNAVPGPQTFSIEGWFKTTTNTGGKIIGFGSSQTGSSSSYDRHVYMMNDGQLVFGVWNNATETVESPNVYNDGQWHYFVATYDATNTSTPNISLYVDGQLVGTATSSSAQSYTGYWRVGGDNLNGWNLDPWGSNSQGTTEPNSYYFNGTIANVAVYPTALTAAQVSAHYAAALNQGG